VNSTYCVLQIPSCILHSLVWFICRTTYNTYVMCI